MTNIKNYQKCCKIKVREDISFTRTRTKNRRLTVVDDDEEDADISVPDSYQELTAALLEVFNERMQDKYEGKKEAAVSLLEKVEEQGSVLKRDRSVLGSIIALVTVALTIWGTTCETSEDS